MSKFDYKKYIKDNKFTISKAPEQRMINERFFMGGIVTNGLALNNPFETKQSVNEEVVVWFYDKSYQYAASTDNAPLPSNLKNVKDPRKLEKYIKSHLHGKDSWAEIKIDGKEVGRYKADKGFYMMESKQSVNELIVDKRDIKNNIGSTVKVKMGNKTMDVVLSDLEGNTVYLMTKGGKSGKVTVDRFLSMVESVTEKKQSVNESKGSREIVKKIIAQDGYEPIFYAIDDSKRDLKRAGYTRGEIQVTLIDMFDIGDPKVLKKIKE